MTSPFPKKELMQSLLVLVMIALPAYVIAADYYSSELINQSNQSGSDGFRLVRTKVWPNAACVIDTGMSVVNPGEKTALRIKKASECKESGVGYSIYKMDDEKNEHLIGYLSHRLGEGKFSVQVSRFCEGKQCVFHDLNPQQGKLHLHVNFDKENNLK